MPYIHSTIRLYAAEYTKLNGSTRINMNKALKYAKALRSKRRPCADSRRTSPKLSTAHMSALYHANAKRDNHSSRRATPSCQRVAPMASVANHLRFIFCRQVRNDATKAQPSAPASSYPLQAAATLHRGRATVLLYPLCGRDVVPMSLQRPRQGSSS